MSSAADKLRFLLELQERSGGAIPFERWMAEALYHPSFGYYTANVRRIGRGGDFTTWPLIHDSLGRAIARWALAARPARRWHIIEAGAGSGDLAASVLRSMGWWRRPRYHIVEISPILRQAQREKLGGRVLWHDSMREALDACHGAAVIFSNELVDAFPCRIFQKQSGLWKELALRIEQGRFFEVWRDASLPDSSIFSCDWPDGQRVETQFSYRAWMQEWLPSWRSGAMLTIDYGDRSPSLYHRRPRGSLRAYSYQQRLEAPDAYAGFGLRDLTVDVNFSDLEAWSPGAAFLPLGTFLQQQGQPIASGLAEAAAAFKALIQAR